MNQTGLNPASRTTALALTLLLAFTLVACTSNPIVQWSAPQTPQGDAASTLDFGRAYSERVRMAYKQAIVTQLQESSSLVNGLVITGAAIAALALGGVHHDVVVGASLLGGTAYTLGNINLSRPRLLVYQAAVEALNCADRAVAPFNMRRSELQMLEMATLALDAQRKVVSTQRQTVSRLLTPYISGGQGDTDAPIFAKAILDRATGVQKASDEGAQAGRALANGVRDAETELILAVNKIDAAAGRASLETVPDLTAVKSAIASLPQSLEILAPGTGVGASVAAELAKFKGSAKAQEVKKSLSNQDRELAEAAQTLEAEVQTLADRIADVNAHLAGRNAALTPDAFKDCGVTQIVMPLKTFPEALQFTIGQDSTRSLIITGGSDSYLMDFEATVPGITVRQPMPKEHRAEVTVSKDVKTPQTLALRVLDFSTPMRIQTVLVTVGPGAVTTAPITEGGSGPVMGAGIGGAGNSKPAVIVNDASPVSATQIKQALDALHDGPIVGLPVGMVIRAPSVVADGNVKVALKCPTGLESSQKRTAAEVSTALLKQIGISASETVKAKVLPQATDVNGKTCLK